MENEILSKLIDIKITVFILLAVITLGVIANWVRAGVTLKNVVKKELDDLFTEEASHLYEEGRFDQLLSYCAEHLKDKPYHSYALWYKAKAYYQKKDFDQAKQSLKQLSEVEPPWDESHVQPFLRKIAAIESENH